MEAPAELEPFCTLTACDTVRCDVAGCSARRRSSSCASCRRTWAWTRSTTTRTTRANPARARKAVSLSKRGWKVSKNSNTLTYGRHAAWDIPETSTIFVKVLVVFQREGWGGTRAFVWCFVNVCLPLKLTCRNHEYLFLLGTFKCSQCHTLVHWSWNVNQKLVDDSANKIVSKLKLICFVGNLSSILWGFGRRLLWMQ